MTDLNSKEARIIEAAKVVFMEKGLEATKMQDIANEAGMSRTCLNYYYRSKMKLFDTVVENLIGIFSPRLVKIMQTDGDFITKIDQIIDEYTDLIIDNPQYPYFMITEITRNPQQIVIIIEKKIEEFGVIHELGGTDQSDTLVIPQIMLSIASLLVTPSLVWPIFKKVSKSPCNFEELLLKRKEYVKRMMKAQIECMNL